MMSWHLEMEKIDIPKNQYLFIYFPSHSSLRSSLLDSFLLVASANVLIVQRRCPCGFFQLGCLCLTLIPSLFDTLADDEQLSLLVRIFSPTKLLSFANCQSIRRAIKCSVLLTGQWSSSTHSRRLWERLRRSWSRWVVNSWTVNRNIFADSSTSRGS